MPAEASDIWGELIAGVLGLLSALGAALTAMYRRTMGQVNERIKAAQAASAEGEARLENRIVAIEKRADIRSEALADLREKLGALATREQVERLAAEGRKHAEKIADDAREDIKELWAAMRSKGEGQ